MNHSERFVVYPCLLVLGAVSVASQGTRPAAPTEATFRKLVLVDETGSKRVSLEAGMNGGLFGIFGPDGKPAVIISGGRVLGGFVWTFGPQGERSVELASTPNGFGSVRTFGPDGREKVALGALDEGGGGAIRVNGPTGNPHISLEARKDGGVVQTAKPSGATIWNSTPP